MWSESRKWSWRWGRRAGVVVLALVCGWWAAVLGADFPDELLSATEVSSFHVSDSRGATLRLEASSSGTRENWVPLRGVSKHLVHATLASEDSGFYDHRGVDWSAMVRAGWLNLKSGRIAFGGSTVTMQLVRLTAGTKRTLVGKVKQAVLAARLERRSSKAEILEQYFNRVYYGNGAWGAEQAAQFYFGKQAAELSVGEAALLAVSPRGPTRYDPFRH